MPPSTDITNVWNFIIGPFGAVFVLCYAVHWLLKFVEKEQGKRESAYLAVTETLKTELDKANKQQDVLQLQIAVLTEKISQLIDQNTLLAKRLEAIDEPLANLIKLITDSFIKPNGYH